MHTAQAAETGIDMYLSIGGAPERVLAATALRYMGGQFLGRLMFRNDDEIARARATGITDLDRKYDLADLVQGDVLFAATGVTDGSMLGGTPGRCHRPHRDPALQLTYRLRPPHPLAGARTGGQITRSATGRRWELPDDAADRHARLIAQRHDLPHLLACVLAMRGIEVEEVP